MPRKRKQREEHVYIEAKIESYEASLDASINPYAFEPQYAWNLHDDDAVLQFTSNLSVTAKLIYPEKRIGEEYEITFYGGRTSSRDLGLTLRDIHVRDEHGARKYRQYRGNEIPVYSPPKGLGLLEKVRGEPRWHGWLTAAPRFVTDALILLGQSQPMFLTIHEHKEGLARWIRNVSLKTVEAS